MCKGEDKQQRGCPLANRVKCTECGLEWECEEVGVTGPVSSYAGNCESCGSSGVLVLRCRDCPVLELERVRANSSAGRLLERVLELDFDTKRLKIGWDEITAEESLGLKILEQERGKWEGERAERRQEEWRQQQAEQAARARQRRGV